MRKTKTTSKFLKEFKAVGFLPELVEALCHLQNNQPLPEKYQDHPLKGNFKGFRDCHIKPDLVLIYKITDDDILELHYLNSHSEIFG